MSEVNINDVVTPVASVPEERGIFARRSGDFKARLQRYQQMEKAQDIRDNLLRIAKKIDTPTQTLAQALCSYRVLRQVHDDETGKPIVGPFDRATFGNPQILLTAFCQQYATHKHDVEQEGELALLTQEIRRLASELSTHTTAAWVNYIRGLKAQWEVDQRLFSNLAHQEGQRKVQQHYIDLVEKFTCSSRGLPKTIEEFETVRDLHEKLCQQRGALKLDVPEEVNHFLKAVAGQGATLDMLTPNVLSWLTEEDDPTRYRIRRL
ncbi:hypothetical protein ACQ1GZ_000720 [Escherichia coli]